MVRKAAVAGSFYTADPDKLRKEVQGYLAGETKPAGRAAGILAPHAGYAFSGAAAGRAFAGLRGLDFDTLVIMATGHREALSGGALSGAEAFATPLGEVPVDAALRGELLKEKKLFTLNDRAHAAEHAVEVQLPFLQVLKGAGVQILPLLFNTSDEEVLEKAGRAVGRALKGRKALFCVSSDLSHYPPAALAEMSDSSALLALRQAMRNGDPSHFGLACGFLQRKAAGEMDTVACGQAPMTAGAAAALELGCNDFELALYTHSGRVSGDDSGVVGYGAGFYTEAVPPPPGALPLTAAMRKELLALARSSASAAIRDGRPPRLGLDPKPEFNQPAAVFVTLTKKGQLRGCIGNMGPAGTLADMVSCYACAAALEDPRFDAVTQAELAKLKVEISVLSPLRRVPDASYIKEGVHGVYVKSGRRSGTYLPQVWEHFPGKEQFLDSLCAEKAGLDPSAWRAGGAELYVYTVEAFEES